MITTDVWKLYDAENNERKERDAHRTLAVMNTDKNDFAVVVEDYPENSTFWVYQNEKALNKGMVKGAGFYTLGQAMQHAEFLSGMIEERAKNHGGVWVEPEDPEE